MRRPSATRAGAGDPAARIRGAMRCCSFMRRPRSSPSAEIAPRCALRATGASPQRPCLLAGRGWPLRERATIFAEAGIPTYDTPEDAVRAFLQIVAVPPQPGPADAGAAVAVRRCRARPRHGARGGAAALAAGRTMLSEPEAKAVLRRLWHPGGRTRAVADASRRRCSGARDRLSGRAQDPFAGHDAQVRRRRRRARSRSRGGRARRRTRRCSKRLR